MKHRNFTQKEIISLNSKLSDEAISFRLVKNYFFFIAYQRMKYGKKLKKKVTEYNMTILLPPPKYIYEWVVIPVHVNLHPRKWMYQSYLLPAQVLQMKMSDKLVSQELLASSLAICILREGKRSNCHRC